MSATGVSRIVPLDRCEEWVSVSDRKTSRAGIEFILAPEAVPFHQNYRPSMSPQIQDAMEISFHGRKIQVIGIDECEAREELRQALRELADLVVDIRQLAQVVDGYIVGYVMKTFQKLIPSMPLRTLGRNGRSLPLDWPEYRQIRAEIDRFESDLTPSQKELREALQRLRSSKAQRGLLDLYEPIITAQEIACVRTGMQIKKMQKAFLNHLFPVLNPLEIKKLIEEIPSRYRDHFDEIAVLLGKRIQIFKTLKGSYFPLCTTEFVLGEELCKRIGKRLPIRWRIPKENVTRLREQITSAVKNLNSRSEDSEEELLVLPFATGQTDQAAEELLDKFKQTRDYILDDLMISEMLPFTRMPLHPWPRIDRLTSAFRKYERIQRLVGGVTDEMFHILETIKKEDPKQWMNTFEQAATQKERIHLLKPILSKAKFSADEEDICIEFLSHFISAGNQLLLDPMPPSHLNPEFRRVVRQIEKKLSPLERIDLLQQLESLNTVSRQLKLLEPFGMTSVLLEDRGDLVDFVMMHLSMNRQTTGREQLLRLEFEARKALIWECNRIGVEIVIG